MRTIDRIKRDCEAKGLDFEIVMENCGFYPQQLRYFNGKLYGSRYYLGDKLSWSFKREVILEDCI